MNKLPVSKRAQILNLLVEGMSLRATSRIADVSFNTVSKLQIEAGRACQDFHDATVNRLKCKRIQCDEIWSFVYSKEKNVPEEHKGKGRGDIWTWVGIDADTKLVLSWLVGNRDSETAYAFIGDLKSRIRNRVQLTTDGHSSYLEAVRDTFGSRIDYAMLIKKYGPSYPQDEHDRRYSPSPAIGFKTRRILGNPDPAHICTNHVERQNLTMRMHIRRFTRLTNAFSKKVENHSHSVALHFVYYNFIKIHKTLRVTPAMEAGLAKDVMSFEEIVSLLN